MSQNILIVYTHPNHESLNYSFFESTLNGIKKNDGNHSVKTIDLYEDQFNPALIFNEDNLRRHMHKDPETEIYRSAISWADHIVFVYPIWWGRPPAMLLGFFDRVFATNFAYQQGKGFQVKGLLEGKEVTCISTMKGPTGYPALFLNNAHKILMRRAVFNFCGIKKIRFFEFGGMESRSKKQQKALTKVENYFATV